MTTTTAPTAIDIYDDLLAAKDGIMSDMQAGIDALIPSEVQADIEDLRSEYAPKIELINNRIEAAKAAAQADAIKAGQSLRSARYIAVYSKAGKTVKVDDVLALAAQWQETHPDMADTLRSIITITKPAVRVQVRRDMEF